MAQYQPVTHPFVNKGMAIKVEPSQLQPGQFQRLINMSSAQEGAINICLGTQRKNPVQLPTSFLVHTIAKLRKGGALVGTVSTSGTAVTRLTGQPFPAWLPNSFGNIFINGVYYGVVSWTDADHITLLSSAGSQSNAPYTASADFRYLGASQYIQRGSATDAGPFPTCADLGSTGDLQRWTSEDFAAGVSGDSLKFFATSASRGLPTTGPNALPAGAVGMLKDDGTMSPLQVWGIRPPTRPVTAVSASSRLVNTTGTAVTWVSGPFFPASVEGNTVIINSVNYTVETWTDNKNLVLAATAGAQDAVSLKILPVGVSADYDWLYTFRNIFTRHESNPCVPMIANNFQSADGSYYTLTLHGTNDPQISTDAMHQSIAIYRRGGLFADGLYRLIGYVTNPGSFVGTATFTDNIPDENLVNARTIEFDNDMPVSSNLPIPLSATINSASSTMLGGAAYTITLNALLTPDGVGDLSTLLRPGTPVTISKGTSGTDDAETVYVETVSTGMTFTAYLQGPHQNNDRVEASYVINQPCRLCCQAFGSFFLAGDTNNPHLLYKAKTARPEAWPIVNLQNGASGNIVVGSPSNPIMAITEFNGVVVCLNLSGIFIVRVWQGLMQAPIEAPAKRGLIANFAWTKVGNELWYLSYDGIYSWAGGIESKRSEAINPIFMGQTVNGIPPIDMSPGTSGGLEFVTCEYHNHEFNMIYRDAGGQTRRLRYSLIYDRWYIRDDGQGPNDGNGAFAVYAMHLDQDTGNLVLGKYLNVAPPSLGAGTFIEYDTVGTSDSWTALPTDGSPIPFEAFTEFYNLGSPSANKHWGDLVLELDNTSCTSLTVAIYWDFSTTADTNNTFTIPAASGRRTVALPIQDGAGLATGHDARAMAVKISGSSAYPLYLYSLTFNALPLELQQRGRAYDWSDLGHPYDKNLRELTVEYDMGQAGGNTVTLCLDAKSGVAGTVETLNVQTWTLTGTGRCRANFAVKKDVILKMARLRPVILSGQANSFMLWDYKFVQDNWPADSISATPWTDEGSPYDKYYQQVDLEIDTGGTGCDLKFWLDGSVAQTLPNFSTISSARHVNFTLNPNLKGKQARLEFTPGTNGKAQLFSYKFITLPADKGAVLQTYDWDDLGHPFDKRLKTVTLEYELNGGANVTMQMDTLSGIKGSTINTNVQQFLLDGAGRSKFTAPIALDTICKMIRLYPVSDNFLLKHWAYKFDKTDFPADIVAATEWDTLGYPCEKLLRELSIEMDTGSVPCSVAVQIDGATAYTFSMTTTLTDKGRMITMPSRPTELKGLLFRLVFTPGSGGKAQYFTHNFNRIILPCSVTHFSAFEQSFGDNGYHLAKQLFIDYICSGSITISVYTDNRTLFYQKTLPPHTGRDVERFYLPAINAGVLNKSRKYAIDVDSADLTKPFQIFKDSCRIETKNLNGDARTPWKQSYIWQDQPIPGL